MVAASVKLAIARIWAIEEVSCGVRILSVESKAQFLVELG